MTPNLQAEIEGVTVGYSYHQAYNDGQGPPEPATVSIQSMQVGENFNLLAWLEIYGADPLGTLENELLTYGEEPKQ